MRMGFGGKFVLLVLALVAVSGCRQAQRPYRFNAAGGNAESAVDSVVRGLANEGMEAKEVDRSAGTVFTAWQDLGPYYGMAGQKEPGVLVRRYIATVSPAGEVTVRADFKACEAGGFVLGAVELRGTCTLVDGVTEGEQAKLDELGQRLERATGGAPTAPAAPAAPVTSL